MKILVTGAKGFIGKNLCSSLRLEDRFDVLEYDKDSTEDELTIFAKEADFVVHLAGVNRPLKESEFYEGNTDLTKRVVDELVKNDNVVPILLSSSVQAESGNSYGISKKNAEILVLEYSEKYFVESYIFRFPNLFGKWCRPNYNSVTATFCHNIANGLPIEINNENALINLVYIDDVVDAIISCIDNEIEKKSNHYYEVNPVYPIKVGALAQLIKSFNESRLTRVLPNVGDSFIKKLYSTYTSYIPTNEFSYHLIEHKDERGSFTEFLRSENSGQVSINVSKPGISKGEHWHKTKIEKYLVVFGEAEINLRDIFSDEVITYNVSGSKLEVVDIPVGYTHNIVNVGSSDLVTVMWANENFDAKNPDTFIEIVEEKK